MRTTSSARSRSQPKGPAGRTATARSVVTPGGLEYRDGDPDVMAANEAAEAAAEAEAAQADAPQDGQPDASDDE